VLRGLLTAPGGGAEQVAAYRPVLETLRPATGTPSEAAADAVLALLDRSKPCDDKQSLER